MKMSLLLYNLYNPLRYAAGLKSMLKFLTTKLEYGLGMSHVLVVRAQRTLSTSKYWVLLKILCKHLCG